MCSPLAVLIGHWFFGLHTEVVKKALTAERYKIKWPTVDVVTQGIVN